MRLRWTTILVAGAVALAGCGREVGSDTDGSATADGAATDDGATDDGGDDGGDGGDDGDDGGDDGGGDAQAVSCEEGETDGDLLLYNWSEYMDPDLLTAFGEEFGVSATEDTYTSNEALLAQIRAGGADYDVIIPSDYMVEIMAEEGILLELDKDAIPNAANVDDAFSSPPYDPDLTYTQPYQWGTTGIGLDLEAVGDDPEATWGWLFDPEMAGDLSISMLDDPRETMGAALYYLGYDPNTQDEAELQEAADLVAEADWVTTFTSDQYSELLLTGETTVGHGYSGTFLDAMYGADDPDRFTYVIPEEGATIWTDNMAILANAQHPCTAHAFINFILDAENGAQLTNWTYYASPNAAATEFIEAEVLEDPAIYPEDDVRDNLFFLENTGEAEILYTDLFTQAQG